MEHAHKGGDKEALERARREYAYMKACSKPTARSSASVSWWSSSVSPQNPEMKSLAVRRSNRTESTD